MANGKVRDERVTRQRADEIADGLKAHPKILPDGLTFVGTVL